MKLWDWIPSGSPPKLSYTGKFVFLGKLQSQAAEIVAASMFPLYKNLSARHRVILILQWLFKCFKITTCLLYENGAENRTHHLVSLLKSYSHVDSNELADLTCSTWRALAHIRAMRAERKLVFTNSSPEHC